MKYCSKCGATVTLKIPKGEHELRHVCDVCHTIHYINPKIITGCLAEWQGKVLLCKRAIEPRLGKWTIPAGFMECGETIMEGAARETHEEALAVVENMQLFAVYNITHISHVNTMFRGTVKEGRAAPGDESLEVGFFSEEEIPWDELAFPVTTEMLQRYFEDRRTGSFSLHMADVYRDESNIIHITRHS